MSAAQKTSDSRERPTKPSTEAEHGATVPVPVVTPHLKVYRLHVPAPGVREVADAGRSAASHLPPPERLAFYGGLGAMAVFGVVSWPVAAAIGAGTVIAQRAARSAAESRQKAKEDSGDAM